MKFTNYRDFKKHHRDIEIGSEKFNTFLLKKINKGSVPLSSERTNSDIEMYFRYTKKTRTHIYDFIENNLPFDLLTKIDTTNENKISLFFQKGLAREISVYLNFTNMSITQKQYFLGWSFFFCQLIYNREEFIQKKMVKDKYYEFAQSDFDEFLRTEGYNIYKTL